MVAHLLFPNSAELLASQHETRNGASLSAYAVTMDYLSQHLTSLRQEITELRNMNLQYSQRGEHVLVEQTASAVRENRLLQIKQELSSMMNCPPDPAVWWDKLRRARQAA